MKIALSIVVALFMLGCSSEEKEVTSNEVQEKTPVVEAEKSMVEKVSTITTSVEETTADVVAEVQEKASALTTSVEETTADVVAEVQEKASALTTSVEETTADVVATVVPENTNGKALYSACASCHGTSGEKPALGKSAVIQGWSKEQVLDALNGYSDGSYGAALKGMMKVQADKLDADEKEAISEYISNF